MTQQMYSFLQQLLNEPVDIVVDNAQIPSASQLEIAFASSFGENNNIQARRQSLPPRLLSSPPPKSCSNSCNRWSASETSSEKSSTPPRLPAHRMRSTTKAIDVLPPPPLPLAKASSFEDLARRQKSKRRGDTWKFSPLPMDAQLVNNSPRSSLELLGEAIDSMSNESLELLGEAIDSTLSNDSSLSASTARSVRQSRMISCSADAFQ
jgi:hypothetical protein